jgi:dihydrolipoamide dehydrogenase
MQTYDLIAIGTGSAMMLVEPYLEMHPGAKIAVIDKDPPGGICLTKGCVPTKMLLYPAEVVRIIEEAQGLGIRTDTIVPEFESIMKRVRSSVGAEIQRIESGLKKARGIDY